MDIAKGKRLFTRDGRRVGNGIVLSSSTLQHPEFGLTTVHDVVTDFGNTMRCTFKELDELYYLDYEPQHIRGLDDHSLDEWFATRHRLILGEEEPNG